MKRRDFLAASGGLIAAGALGNCQAQQPPAALPPLTEFHISWLLSVSKRQLDWSMHGWEVNNGYRRQVLRISDELESPVPWFRRLVKEFIVYGNAVATPRYRFTRQLRCPHCGYAWHIDEYGDISDWGRTLKWRDMQFVGSCRECRHEVIWEMFDIPAPAAAGSSGNLLLVELSRLPAYDPYRKSLAAYSLEDLYMRYSGGRPPGEVKPEICWQPSEFYQKYVREGDWFFVTRTPVGVLEAVREQHMLALLNAFHAAWPKQFDWPPQSSFPDWSFPWWVEYGYDDESVFDKFDARQAKKNAADMLEKLNAWWESQCV